MNWVERQLAKLAWRRVMKVFPWLKRWIPLLSVIFLVGVTVLRAVGKLSAATSVEAAAQFLGLVVTDPEMAAGAGAGVGVLLKMLGMFREATSPDNYLPPRRFAGVLAIALLGLSLVACEEPPLPTAPNPVNVSVNVNQNQGTGNQSPTGPGEGGCEAVRFVELRFELGGIVSDHVAPGQTGTVVARALSASRSPITEGRCLPAPTWAKTGQCDLGGDATAFSRTLTGRTSGAGSCTVEVSVSEAQGTLILPVR